VGSQPAHNNEVKSESLLTRAAAARAAQSVGLGVNAGHDLNLRNLRDEKFDHYALRLR